MPVGYYGFASRSITSREKLRLRLFEKRVLRGIFESTSDEMTVKWRKLHNEKLNDLYFYTNTFLVIKSRRIRWVGACRTYGRNAYTGFSWRNLNETDHWGDPGVDGRIILRWIFRKWDVGRYGLD